MRSAGGDRPGSVLQASLVRMVRRGAWGHAGRLLEKSHPADIAAVLDRLTESDCKAVFHLIGASETRAEVLALLESGARADLIGGLEPEAATRILEHMPADDAALILRDLPRALSESVLTAMGDGARDIETLLDFPEDTAGAIMAPEVIALPADLTVKEAVERLQQHENAEASFYVYVVDDQGQLVGVLSLRQLIMQPSYTELRNCMVTEPIRVTTDTDQEDVARIVARYDLLAVPVVDAVNRLVGVVTVDDVIDVMREEATEDILKMAGTTVEEVLSPGVFRGAWIRFPWLAASFVGGLGAVFLMDQFELMLAKAVQLAFFLPIILGMGGNVASQCAMVVVRGIATGRLQFAEVGRILGHELGTGIVLGLTFAVGLAGAAVLIGYGPVRLPLVVGLGIFGSMMIAATVGTVLPLAFSRLGVDPAVASGPFVTTSTDVLGIASFFLIAYSLL
jgi:magnesium transporter